jgi:hypothetical protein
VQSPLMQFSGALPPNELDRSIVYEAYNKKKKRSMYIHAPQRNRYSFLVKIILSATLTNPSAFSMTEENSSFFQNAFLVAESDDQTPVQGPVNEKD